MIGRHYLSERSAQGSIAADLFDDLLRILAYSDVFGQILRQHFEMMS